MKLIATDFPKLQYSVLAALLMILVGAGVGFAALSSTQLAKRDLAAAQTERNDVDGKLKRVRSEEQEIKQKSERFNALRALGVIGEEQRLEWVELLKEIRDKRRLIDLQYEFSPQRPLDATPGNDFAFYASALKVQITLLHEEDLLRFLDDLRQQARALIQIKQCNVSRLPRDGESSGSGQLVADCLIDWVTVHEVAIKP